MKLSPQWVRELVDLAVDDHRLAEDLTSVGIAAEGISGSGADTVFEMEIGTNRPDVMNHYGVAREAAAIYDLPLKQLSALSHPASAEKHTSAAKASAQRGSGGTTEVVPFPIILEEPELCPRFTARVIRGTHIKHSPEKIANRLRLLDQRPISNAVDATNYVLWEIGKPTHVYDQDLLEGGKLIVRMARDGEKLKTLDGVERTLTSEDLVVPTRKGRWAWPA
jgi:phenylalanyl-tRNA synthetase beta chain